MDAFDTTFLDSRTYVQYNYLYNNMELRPSHYPLQIHVSPPRFLHSFLEEPKYLLVFRFEDAERFSRRCQVHSLARREDARCSPWRETNTVHLTSDDSNLIRTSCFSIHNFP